MRTTHEKWAEWKEWDLWLQGIMGEDRLAEVMDPYLAGRINDADARLKLIELLNALGHMPTAGSMEAVTMCERLQLFLDHHFHLVFGARKKTEGEAPYRAWSYPAWELIRIRQAATDDGWLNRFERAGGRLREGRMVAIKGDPVWAILGSSQFFTDALDIDHPPFSFNSGMGWRDVERDECIVLGVIDEEWRPSGFNEWREGERRRIGADKIPKELVKAAVKELEIKNYGKAGLSHAEKVALKKARWDKMMEEAKEAYEARVRESEAEWALRSRHYTLVCRWEMELKQSPVSPEDPRWEGVVADIEELMTAHTFEQRPKWVSRAWRLKAELFKSLNDDKNEMLCLQWAQHYNPKAPVKRRLRQLEKMR